METDWRILMMSQLYCSQRRIHRWIPCALLNLRRQPIRKPFSAFAHHERSSRVNRIGALLAPDSPLFRDDRRTKNEEAKRDETKTSPSTTPAIVVLLVHRNHRAPRSDPARPGPARDRVLQRRFRRDGSGPRCQPVFLGRGPSQVIGYSWSPARNWETQRNVTRDSRRAIDCLAVTSTYTRVYPFSSSHDFIRDQSEIERLHWYESFISSSNVENGYHLPIVETWL